MLIMLHTKDILKNGPGKKGNIHSYCFLFDLILYVPSTIFQICREGSSWVEPVLS